MHVDAASAEVSSGQIVPDLTRAVCGMSTSIKIDLGEASGTPKAHDGAADAGPDAAGRPPSALGRRSDQFRQGASSAWATGVCGECAPLHCRLCTARGRWLVRAGDGSHRGPPSGRSVTVGDSAGSHPSPSVAAWVSVGVRPSAPEGFGHAVGGVLAEGGRDVGVALGCLSWEAVAGLPGIPPGNSHRVRAGCPRRCVYGRRVSAQAGRRRVVPGPGRRAGRGGRALRRRGR